MKIGGTTRIELAPAQAWERLSDPQALGEALPAVERVEVAGDGGFEAGFRPLTGLGTTPMTVEFRTLESEAPRRLAIAGSGTGTDFALRLRADLELSPAGEGTDVEWSLELHLHGVLHSLTQRVIEQVASQQVAAVLAAVGAPTASVSG